MPTEPTQTTGSEPSRPSVPPRKGGSRKPSAAPFSAAAPRPAGRQPKGQQASFKARKRRRQQLVGGGIIGVVVIVIVVFVIVGLGSKAKSGPTGSSAVSSATLASVEAVSPATSATINANSVTKVSNPPIATGGGGLTLDGKPEVLYIGAEYCPYCAGERWALVLALSKFGTFSNLHSIISSATDTLASIPTFTFVGSTYTSPYLSFVPVETETVSEKPLQNPTKAEQALFQKYDYPPYVPSSAEGGIPFIDIGNYAAQDGLGYSSDASLQHESFASVANQIATQYTQTGAEIVAEAGVLESDICHIDGGKSLDGNAACKAFPSPITQPPAGA